MEDGAMRTVKDACMKAVKTAIQNARKDAVTALSATWPWTLAWKLAIWAGVKATACLAKNATKTAAQNPVTWSNVLLDALTALSATVSIWSDFECNGRRRS